MDSKSRRVRSALAVVITLITSLIAISIAYLCFEEYQSLEENKMAIVRLASEKDSLTAELENLRQKISEAEEKTEEIAEDNAHFTNAREQYFLDAMELERRVEAGETDLKIAYLTFDDGPYEATTGRFLDVLDQYGILATFFQLGKTTEIHDQLYHRIYNSGHTIGNHTYSHLIKNIYQTVDTFMEDVMKNRQFIEDKLGYTTTVMRFPGGSSQAREKKAEIIERLREAGYAYADWDAECYDGKYINLTPEEYRDNLFSTVGEDEKFLVVLMHDYCEGTLGALPEIIEGLQARGYVFLPLFYESKAVHR